MRYRLILCLTLVLLAACQPEPNPPTPTAVVVSEATPDSALLPFLSTLPTTPTPWPTATLDPSITPTYQPTPTLQPLLAEGGALPHGALDRIGIGLIRGNALSPDGTQMALATTTGIYVYHTADFSLAWRRYLLDAPLSIDWSADGAHLVSGAYHPYGQTIIWDAATGNRLVEIDRTYSNAVFSPDGSQFVVATKYPYPGQPDADGSEGQTNRLLLLDIQGNLIHVLESNTTGYYGLEIFFNIGWSPDGRYVAATHVGEGSETFIWEAASGELLTVIDVSMVPYPNFIRFSPDSRYVATKLSDGQAVIWDLQTDELDLLIDHLPFLYDVVWSPNGQQIVTLGRDTTFFRDSYTGDIRKRLDYRALAAAWSPDGTKLALEGNQDALITDESGEQLAVLPGGLYSHGNAIVRVLWLPDNQHVITLAGDDLTQGDSVVDIGLWEWETETFLTGMHPSLEPFRAAWTPDSRDLLLSVRQIPYFGNPPEFFYIWDNQTHEITREQKSGNELLNNIFEWEAELKPPNLRPEYFPSPYEDITLRYEAVHVCENRLENDQCFDTWRYVIRHKSGWQVVLGDEYNLDSMQSMAWSWDGLLLAVGRGLRLSPDEHDVVAVIDPFTGEELFVFEGHSASIYDLAFSPSGDRLASVSADGTVIIWDLTR